MFSPVNHRELQAMWYGALYAEALEVRRKPLRAVDKYRVRRKNPLPKTIWDGDMTVYCYKQKWRQSLKDCYDANRYTLEYSCQYYNYNSRVAFVLYLLSCIFKEPLPTYYH